MPPAARLLAAALLGLLLSAAPAAAQDAPEPQDLVINEIFYNPPDAGEGQEFIEILNRSDEAFDLSRFSFSDANQNRTPVAATADTLAPGGYVVLVRDSVAFQTAFPEAAFTEPPSWPTLNNSGDEVFLYFETEGEPVVIDRVPYDPDWGGNDNQHSLERIDPAGPSTSASNFGTSTAEAGGTPGAQNTLFAVDETPPALTAATPAEDGQTLTATFSEPLDPASVAAGDFSLEPSSAPSITAAAVGEDAAQVALTLQPALTSGDYTLVVQGVQDPGGNVLDEDQLAFSFFRPAVPDPGDVVVNEIYYAPPDADLEFVEVLNRSDETFDLSAFSIADSRAQPVPVGGASVRLGPGDYGVLVRDGARFAESFPDVPFTEVADWPALNDGGDTAALLFEGTTIDAVPYEPSWGGTDDASLERRDPAGPSASPTNFGSSTDPDGATPGAQNSLFGRDTAPPRPVFAETVGPATVDVFFDEPLDPASVAAGDFALGGAAPQDAVLIESGTGVRLSFGSAVTAQTLTVRGVRDLSGNVLGEATIGLAFAAEAADLVINEIMYDPLSDDFDGQPDQPEYFEVLNRSARTIKLDGLFWTDVADEEGEADTTRFDVERRAVAPGGFAVVYAARGEGDLTAAFPAIDFAADSLTLVPIGRSSLGLLNSGDLIHLQRSAAGGGLVSLDSVRYDPDWHNPGLEDATGVALERIQPEGPAGDPGNWESSTAEAGGTPGRPNAAFLPPGQAPPEGEVAVEPSPFYPEGDGQTAIRYALGEAASLVRVRIFDAQGRRVRTLERAALAGRTGQIPWDGRGDGGERLGIGIYVVLLEALDARGGTAEAYKEPLVIARPFD